jgi:hypothetical protein
MTTSGEHEPTEEQREAARQAREKLAADREERGDATEGPSSSETSGEDPAAEVAATYEGGDTASAPPAEPQGENT